jgi:NADPH:quinone reductase-like Zn-dependent oxidoreductase
VAVASASKAEALLALGADSVIPRGDSILTALGHNAVDVVVDLVAGTQFKELIDTLKRGGRYAVAGAIAGPVVELDVRTLYLKDLTFLGCTFQDDIVFDNLVEYIERGDIRPLVARTYPLRDIVAAQKDFLAKKFLGKLVLLTDAG